MFAINLHPLLPVRAEASERSEQVTQLLFGERVQTGDLNGGFTFVTNHADGYTGWVDTRMLTPLEKSTWEMLNEYPLNFTTLPVTEVISMEDNSVMRLSCGSILPAYNQERCIFGLGDTYWSVSPEFVKNPVVPSLTGISQTAFQFLHTPYLWGGKGIFGIDCSGFTQIVYRIHGVNIPRDAKDQALCGNEITSLSKAQTGDLVFFAAEGKSISHVGILLDRETVLHASGAVRLDKITDAGIVSTSTVTYTKPLVKICRYI